MVDTTLVRDVVGGELALMILAVTVLLWHGLALWLRELRSRPRLVRGREILIAALQSGSLSPQGLAYLRRLAPRLQITLYLSVARNLQGDWRGQLSQFATQTGLVARAQKWCHSRFWWNRLRGARLLSTLGVSSDVGPLLLFDHHSAVRVQAAEWTSEHPTPVVVESLLDLLSSSDTLPRYTVQDSLLRMGRTAVQPLAEYLMNRSGPEVEPALEIAAGLADPSLLPAALHLCSHPVPGVRARAAECIGALGGTEAVDILVKMLADDEPRVRAEAAGAL